MSLTMPCASVGAQTLLESWPTSGSWALPSSWWNSYPPSLLQALSCQCGEQECVLSLWLAKLETPGGGPTENAINRLAFAPPAMGARGGTSTPRHILNAAGGTWTQSLTKRVCRIYPQPRGLPPSLRGGCEQLLLTILARQLYHELVIKISRGRQ